MNRPPYQPRDPILSAGFWIEILPKNVVAAFSECSGLTMDNDVIEYRTGTDPFLSVRKLPGLRKYTNIVLKRGFTTSDYLWQWRKMVIEPKKGDVYRRSGQIVLHVERACLGGWTSLSHFMDGAVL